MSQVRKDVLNGWKEIAAYLGRDPRTVERWEKSRSLPVRRLPGSGRATVYALVAELDAWLASPVREPERQGPLALDVEDVPEEVPSPQLQLPELRSPELRSQDSLGESVHSASELDAGNRRMFPAGLRWAVAAVLLVLALGGGIARFLRNRDGRKRLTLR